MRWRTTVLQTAVVINPQRGLIQKQHVLICFGTPLLSKLSSYKPAQRSYAKTICFNMRWRTTVLQTISRHQGLIRQEHVLIRFDTPLFSKL